MRIATIALAIAAMTATPGCASRRAVGVPSVAAPPSVVFLRQPKISTPSAMMTLVGTLRLSPDGCLTLAAADQDWLIFWPPETRLSRAGGKIIFADSAGQRFTTGDRLELGGTGAGPPRISALGGVVIPEPCRKIGVWITHLKGVKKLAE